MSESNRRVLAALSVLLTILCLALFLIPAFVIRPFRYQSPRSLSLAIRMKSIAPTLSAIALAALLLLAAILWRTTPKWARVGLMIAVALSAAAAVMARLNYFEWMFRPIPAAEFVSAGDARLADEEMVMAVKIGPEARAYPVRQMAYHHVLNDTVGGEPIVVTY